MNVHDVAVELAARLTAADIRTYVGPPDSISVGPNGAAVIVMPELITYDQTYGRGSDSMTWPLLVLAGKVTDRLVLGRIGQFCDGSGDLSIKALLEATSTSYTSCDSVRVVSVQLDTVTWQGTDFQGALFELHIFGSGA